MTRRWRSGHCSAATVALPARRAACRPVTYERQRLYVAVWEDDGAATVDVVDDHGGLSAQWRCGGAHALAVALLADATGHPPRPAIADAFADEVLGLLPRNGFALASGEICAWLLLRAIERASY
jgi:hypothetical protein